MSNRSDFKRIRRIRLCWVWGLTIATLLLFVCLLFTWMEVKWWIFPLQGFMVDVFENLFFSFTTGTIMMWFQSSVDGYAQMREEYKEIELNTKALPNTRLDVYEDYVKHCEGFDPDEDMDAFYIIDEWVKTEHYLNFREYPKDLYTKEQIDEMYLDYEKGYFKGVEAVANQFYKWIKQIDVQIVRNEFNRYIDILEKWLEQLKQNEYYYNPAKPDALELTKEFCEVFFYRLKHERVTVWYNEDQEDEYCVKKLDVIRELKKTNEYIKNRYKTIHIAEMQQLLSELQSMREGYVEEGRWILDIDTIEDREATEAKQAANEDEIVSPVWIEYDHEKTMFLYRTELYKCFLDIDEYGNKLFKEEIGAKKRYGVALLNVQSVDDAYVDEYLSEPPDYHTMNPDYLADIYLRMKKFECLVDNYNREYQADKRAMRKTFERKYRKRTRLEE